DDHLAARDRIVPALVLTGRQHVTRCGGEQDAAAQQRQGVGELHGLAARRRISSDSYTCVPRGASRATRTMARATVSALIGRYRDSGPTKAQATNRLSSQATRSVGRLSARAPTTSDGRKIWILSNCSRRSASSASP